MDDGPLRLGTTSYALLGYLNLRPFTAYELAKQMSLDLQQFSARAESGLYRELKRLEEAGLARAENDSVGKRPRTRYEITPSGRDAMRSWLQVPNSDGFLESEGLVRILFGEQGSREALLDQIGAMVDDAERREQIEYEIVRDYLVTGGQFPERTHVNLLLSKFLIDFFEMVRRWGDWSTEFVGTWEDAGPRPPDDDTLDRYRTLLDAAPDRFRLPGRRKS